MLLGDLLRLAAARHPRKPALVFGAAVQTFAALEAAANRLAYAVIGLGLGPGDTVGILARNRPEHVAALFGVARTGCVLAALSPLSAPEELARMLALADVRLLLHEAEFAPAIAAIAPRCPALARTVVLGDDFEAFVAGMPADPPDRPVGEDDPVAMTFTGGTTGLPKGTVVSHRARLASAVTTALEHELSGNDVVGVVTPLYHAIGLTIWLPAAMTVGATCVLLPRWDARGFVAAVGRHHVTAVMMVPVQARQMLADEAFDAAALASLRKVATGGAPMPPDLPPLMAARLPHVAFVDHYGQSETGPLTVLKPWHPKEKAGTIGVPAVGVELKLVDANGDPVQPGDVGEIVVRGPFTMSGYYRNPAETAAWFRDGDGWGWTGDLARRDADGFVTLVGRSKEMVISGGMNIYPREIELALEGHPAVAECAAFGVPDETWGEAVVAVVVLQRGTAATAEALAAHCAATLARYKRPRLVQFADAIPKTASGKVLKAMLREEFLAQQTAVADR
ncbi:MAG: class I adenylate-forming enzyme family protein [Rhodospirillales bacterium]